MPANVINSWGDRPRTDLPRTNRDPRELERKQRLLGTDRIAPLRDYVSRIRSERGTDRVPDFDSTEAGIEAPILLLLEAPGPKSTRERGGSGFISPDNDDGTAENMWQALAAAGIDRHLHVVTWNIVPWYVGSDQRIRAVTAGDLDDARPWIEELLRVLTRVQLVVLIGLAAKKGWARVGTDLPVIAAPHPSPQNLNTRHHLRQALRDAFAEARRHVEQPEPRSMPS